MIKNGEPSFIWHGPRMVLWFRMVKLASSVLCASHTWTNRNQETYTMWTLSLFAVPVTPREIRPGLDFKGSNAAENSSILRYLNCLLSFELICILKTTVLEAVLLVWTTKIPLREEQLFWLQWLLNWMNVNFAAEYWLYFWIMGKSLKKLWQRRNPLS